MRIGSFYTIILPLKPNRDVLVLATLALLIVIFGGIGVYLAEHTANITNLGDALWWAVVTIATVGYGDYYPVTAVGRIIAVFMMLSGIGIFVLLVDSLSQRRLQRTESRLKSKTQADEEKMVIRNKIYEIEKLIKEVHTLLGPN
jgi:voltage-gated potassium channel